MLVDCLYIENRKRLDFALEKLCSAREVTLVPVKGTINRTQAGLNCLGGVVEILAFSAQGSPVLVTDNSIYMGASPTQLEYDASKRDNIFLQALHLCHAKYNSSKNVFKLECVVHPSVIVASEDINGFTCEIKSPSGNAFSVWQGIPSDLLSECTGVRSFSYTTTEETWEREVTVRKGQTEIFREISHYLNKALFLTRVEGDRIVSRLCITPTGCCEEVMTRHGSRVLKVPTTKMSVCASYYLSACDISLDKLLHAPSLSVAFSGGESA